jgi:hypothetical protein
MTDVPDTIDVFEDGSGLPVRDVLTGRGFITGKSGAGKSNTAGVVAERLLDAGFPLLVVDTDGEYYGLKEAYEVLHVGAAGCDVTVDVDQAGDVAELALADRVPVVLDVSGYGADDAEELVAAVVRELFEREAEHRRPFLLLVEEVHEFVPEQGGRGEAGDAVLRAAKRGRKRGLGVCGISQRPAAVDKDFITQCDWLVWHRLTWANDTRVVARLLGDAAAETVTDLDDGEALLQADWESEVRRVRFRRKETFDAGATPDFDAASAPSLQSVDERVVARLQGDEGEQDGDTGDERESRVDADRVAELEAQLATERERVAELEARLAELTDGEEGREYDPDERDPVWEAGRLSAHVLGAPVRGAKRLRRRLDDTDEDSK